MNVAPVNCLIEMHRNGLFCIESLSFVDFKIKLNFNRILAMESWINIRTKYEWARVFAIVFTLNAMHVLEFMCFRFVVYLLTLFCNSLGVSCYSSLFSRGSKFDVQMGSSQFIRNSKFVFVTRRFIKIHYLWKFVNRTN